MSRKYSSFTIFKGLRDSASYAAEVASTLPDGVAQIAMIKLADHLGSIDPTIATIGNGPLYRGELVRMTRLHLVDVEHYATLAYDAGYDDFADDLTDVVATVNSFLVDLDVNSFLVDRDY